MKSPPATAVELHQVINSVLHDISSHIDEIRASRSKPAKGFADPPRLQVSALPLVPIVKTALATSAGAATGGATEYDDECEQAALVEEAEDDEDGEAEDVSSQLSGRTAVQLGESATLAPATAAVVREDNEAAALADDAVAMAEGPEQRQTQLTQQPEGRAPIHSQSLSAQLVELEAEKVRLKKRKLALLVQQHEERMALEHQRLELEAQRARDESAARRREWQQLLARLGNGGGEVSASQSPS